MVGLSVCLFVGLYVGLSVAFMSPAKTSEPIKLPGGGLTHVSKERCVRWGQSISQSKL